jgi:hypothetical protein
MIRSFRRRRFVIVEPEAVLRSAIVLIVLVAVVSALAASGPQLGLGISDAFQTITPP